MAINCLAPGYIKLFYTANGHNHVLTLPVIPDDTIADYDVTLYDAATQSQAGAVGDLVDLLKPLYPASTSFTGWEAYTQLNCASAPIFRNAGILTAQVGTNGGASRNWGMVTLTWKTFIGGRGKMVLLEGVFGNDSIEPLVGDTGPFGDLSDYLISDDSWVYARDNARLTFPLNYTTKTSDALRKKYIA